MLKKQQTIDGYKICNYLNLCSQSILLQGKPQGNKQYKNIHTRNVKERKQENVCLISHYYLK